MQSEHQPFGFPAAEEQQRQAEPESQARKVAREWLRMQGLRSLYAEFGGLTTQEFEQVRGLLGNPAFGLFYSLLQHQRREYQERLGLIPLSSPQEVAAASVLQGHVRCLDQIREMLLDIADPAAQQKEEE